METVKWLFWGGFKIITDGDWSHEIQRRLLLGRKVMTNLDSLLKIRDVTLPTKVHLVKVMVFPVVSYGCESWTIKKTECQRIDAFELWCWRRLSRVPWTGRRSNQSFLKEISPEYSLEGLMLKLQYSGHQRTDSLEKILMLGKTEGGRRGRQRMRWLDAFTDVTDMSLSKPGVLQSMGSQSQTWLSEWTDIPCLDLFPLFPLPPLSLWVVFSSLSVCLVICYQMPGTANFYLRYFYIPINILSFVMRYSYLESLILSGLAFMFCLVEQSSL